MFDKIIEAARQRHIARLLAEETAQEEPTYTEADLEEAFKAGREGDMVFNNESPKYWDFNHWFEQVKKK